MSEPSMENSPRSFEDNDYEVVRVSVSWGGVSILTFAAILMLQMAGSRIFGLGLTKAVAATLPLSFLGLVLGLIGMRFSRSSKAAKLGVFLNGVVLFCIFVILPLTFLVLKQLR